MLDRSICQHLVVDAVGFIQNCPIFEWASDRIISCREVISEIKDKATKERLQVLPKDVELLTPSTEYIKWVSEFAKKTGDYYALSATDLKVIALTLMVECEMGSWNVENPPPHLRKEPLKPKVNDYSTSTGNKFQPGFFVDKNEDVMDREGQEEVCEDQKCLTEDISRLDVVSETDEDSEIEDSDNENSWITTDNLSKFRASSDLATSENETSKIKQVVCLTSDFAMQNVLKQMGSNVMSHDGRVIEQTRSWIFRCYACFNLTSKMNCKFCPSCGNATLKRVSYSYDDKGGIRIFINTRRPLNTMGKRFSLPKPCGGKHGVNPILSADQPQAQQRSSRVSKTKTDIFHSDVIQGDSPFSSHDVTSRSSRLGITGQNNKTHTLYWMKRNPNVVYSKTGNRRRK